jgi:hypothetical protein
MAKEVLMQMVGLRTSAVVWRAVIEMFSSQYQARIMQLRAKLNQCYKEDKTGHVYLDEIKVSPMRWLLQASPWTPWM